MSLPAFHMREFIVQVRSPMTALMYGLPWLVAPSCLLEIMKTSSMTSPGWQSRRNNRRITHIPSARTEPARAGPVRAGTARLGAIRQAMVDKSLAHVPDGQVARRAEQQRVIDVILRLPPLVVLVPRDDLPALVPGVGGG